MNAVVKTLAGFAVLAVWLWWAGTANPDAGRIFAGVVVFYLTGHLEAIAAVIRRREQPGTGWGQRTDEEAR